MVNEMPNIAVQLSEFGKTGAFTVKAPEFRY
jgi:hypothetical protein